MIQACKNFVKGKKHCSFSVCSVILQERLFPGELPSILSFVRFAFSPLSEEDEEDEQKEPMLKESFGELCRRKTHCSD